jgi:myo-inositol 2-dehydrogenase/D-chiro-inositol 1-dehydrogenase
MCTVGVALIGAGKIGQFHAETLARHLPDARLVAVVDPVTCEAERAAAFGDGVTVDAAPDAALQRAAVDAVVIATPTRLHAPLIIDAARAGKHIFCEKPIALGLDEAQAAVAAAAETGAKLQIGFQRRFDAGYARARQAIERGDIGTVELLMSTTRDPEPPWPGYLESCGGVFLDTTIHDIDSVRFLSGEEVVEVYATASQLIAPDRHGPFDIDTVVTVLRLRSGALASITNSLRTAYGYEAGAEAFGSKGKLVIDGRGDGVRRFGADGAVDAYPQTYRERFGAAYRAELEDFVRCIIDGDEPRVTGEDGVRALEVALAATASQREGRPVRL